LRLQCGWFTDSRLSSLSAQARYLLLACECWSRSNRTNGMISKPRMVEIMSTCATSKEHAYELIDTGLVFFESNYFTVVGLTVDSEEQSIATVEALLCEADADPLRSHWRGCLSVQEEKSKPINIGSWRLAVINKWLNGVSTPKKYENKRNTAHANTIAKIDAMAKYMMEMAADAPKEQTFRVSEKEILEIE
jgi:hypothetical protein